MAQSSEYPALKFVEARAYGNGRDGKSVMFSVIHYTAGSERATSAEDGAAYDARRTDGTSTHFFHDRDSTVQCVWTRNRANAARHRGNRLGVQHELCGTAQTRAQWLDEASLPTLRNAARQVAQDCRKYGLPVRRLTVSETRRAWTEYPNGPKGIVGHVDCTRAFPEDGGDHTDPGEGFPWDIFLDMVRDELDGDDMPTPEDYADAVAAKINPMLSLILLATRQGAAGAAAGRDAEAAEDAAEQSRDAGTQALLENLAAQPELTMADVEQAVRNVINPPPA